LSTKAAAVIFVAVEFVCTPPIQEEEGSSDEVDHSRSKATYLFNGLLTTTLEWSSSSKIGIISPLCPLSPLSVFRARFWLFSGEDFFKI
jgi:hypothetical protein